MGLVLKPFGKSTSLTNDMITSWNKTTLQTLPTNIINGDEFGLFYRKRNNSRGNTVNSD